MSMMSMRMIAALVSLPFLFGIAMLGCKPHHATFERISENGFDAEDNERDWNDYPQSTLFFTPDGAKDGHLYVGTSCGINELIAAAGGLLGEDTGERPPEIRRYRPDLGPMAWERVLDYRDFEDGPNFTATGFRKMAQYRSESDGVKRLYAATFGAEPTIWRTETGEPGSWERFYSITDARGSIRGMAEHNGLLYLAVANDATAGGAVLTEPGRVLATDGETVWPVIEDGFGNPDNGAVMSLISYGDWLYAGTANNKTGFEIWKLEGPGKQGPVKIVSDGGTDPRNQCAITPYVYRGDLYWGSMIFMGMYVKGCVLLRINTNDTWDVIVGPGGLSGFDAGFNNRNNAYLWSLVEHNGWLYAGTADFTSVLQGVVDNLDDFFALAVRRLGERAAQELLDAKRGPGLVGVVTQGGADLWRSQDGVHWTPVFRNGLGDTYNFGVRTLTSVDGVLYLGMANLWDGLEMWRTANPDSN
ncbi:MAG: hypothetical protein HUU46_12770 [Candidatus Hydrogenedentes bacterium]|nr:hypothetical protein [Candidatus Hydrogenedentota bacterium]